LVVVVFELVAGPWPQMRTGKLSTIARTSLSVCAIGGGQSKSDAKFHSEASSRDRPSTVRKFVKTGG
jgi:hypothetical protein